MAASQRHHTWLLRLGLWRAVWLITVLCVLISVALTSGVALTLGAPKQTWPAMLAVSALVPVWLASVMGVVLMRLWRQLDTAHGLIGHMAISDGLTGIRNRRHFMDLASAEFATSEQQRPPLSERVYDLSGVAQVPLRDGMQGAVRHRECGGGHAQRADAFVERAARRGRRGAAVRQGRRAQPRRVRAGDALGILAPRLTRPP